MSTNKKPWPTDAVMIVAATPEEARYDQMDSVHHVNCRDCEKELVADGYTLERANLLEAAFEIPIKFFCTQCFKNYNFNQVNYFEDHRDHKRKSQQARSCTSSQQ